MVELSESPVDEFQDLFVGVDDDILRLDVSMHDSFAVAIV
jgi:hypothetical protein